MSKYFFEVINKNTTTTPIDLPAHLDFEQKFAENVKKTLHSPLNLRPKEEKKLKEGLYFTANFRNKFRTVFQNIFRQLLLLIIYCFYVIHYIYIKTFKCSQSVSSSNGTCQRCILNPAKHLRCSVLRK